MFAKDHSFWMFIGMAFIAGVVILFAFILFSVDPYSPLGMAGYVFVIILMLVVVALLFFIRDPERKIGEGIVSPADGKVVVIDRQKNYNRIAVFMSPLDVHVNRFPIAGEIVDTDHHAGGYIPAYNKDSENNERFTTVLKTEKGEVKVVQIAGVLVRRIITYRDKGEKVKKGDKLGHIVFGSRVDVYIPRKKCKIRVQVGQKVKAGVTTIAE